MTDSLYYIDSTIVLFYINRSISFSEKCAMRLMFHIYQPKE